MNLDLIDLVQTCLDGNQISEQKAQELMALDLHSAEVAHIRWAATEITRKAAHNAGQIYAQIGVDAGPCPANCSFCSLAQCNQEYLAPSNTDGEKYHSSRSDSESSSLDSGNPSLNPEQTGRPKETPAEVPLEHIVEYAQIFDRAGVHLISLMSTAALPFSRYLDIVRAVRSAVSQDMPLLANTKDLSPEQAQELKEAGVQAVYHAKRLGEGEITGISPHRRDQTIAAIQEAGLLLMSAVEPLHQKSKPAEICKAMSEVIQMRPYCAGVGVLTALPDSLAKRQGLVPISRAQGSFFAAIMRLMAGYSIPFGTGGGNVVWVDAGTNPRGRKLPPDEAGLLRDVEQRRKQLRDALWDVPARPLAGWFASVT